MDVNSSQLTCGAAALGGIGAAYFAYRGARRYMRSDARRLREDELSLEAGAVCLNHGSFGTVPKCVAAVRQQLLEEMERHPDRWFRRTTRERFAASVAAAAALVHAPADCVTMVTNATVGVNAVLASMTFADGDEVLFTDWTYQAVKNTVEYICERRGVRSVRLCLDFPVESEDVLVAQFASKLDEHPKVRVCLIDHITSPSAVVMPVRRLVDLCHARNVRVVVDGAHAPGQLHIDMLELGADYYTGNFHKWCFSPRGCALLYVRREYRDEVMPCVISWAWRESFSERFENLGTRDHTPMFTVVESLKFIEEKLGGQEAMMRYNSELVEAAVAMLAKAWGTERLDIPKDMQAPFMRLVRLPLDGLFEDPDSIMMELYDSSNVMVCTFGIKGVHYCRISANVYNEFSEYEILAKAVLQLRERKLREAATLGNQ